MKCPSGLMTGRILGKFFSFSYCSSRLRGWMKPSLKKPGDFTVAEGHGHPLRGWMKCPSSLMTGRILGKFFSFSYYPSLSVPIKGMDETKFKETGGLHSGRRSRAPTSGLLLVFYY